MDSEVEEYIVVEGFTLSHRRSHTEDRLLFMLFGDIHACCKMTASFAKSLKEPLDAVVLTTDQVPHIHALVSLTKSM